MIDWHNVWLGENMPGWHTPGNESTREALDRLVKERHGPCLLVSERELSVLRRGLTKDGWKRGQYLHPVDNRNGLYACPGVLAAANLWLEEEITPTDWSQDSPVSCCQCDSNILLFRDPDSPSNSCDNLGFEIKIPAWQAQIRRLASAAISLSLVYCVEKDKVYADKAFEILLTCADSISSAKSLPKNESDGQWVIALAQAYDLIYKSQRSRERKDRIEQVMHNTLAKYMSSRDVKGAEGAWRLAALGMLGLAARKPEMVYQALTDLTRWLCDLDSDGLLGGPISKCHFNALAGLLHFTEACHRSGINVYKLEPERGKSVKAMFMAPLKYTYPSFRIPAIKGDHYDIFLPLELYEIACRRWNDAGFAWVLKRGYAFGASPINMDQERFFRRFERKSLYALLFGRDLTGRLSSPVPNIGSLAEQGLLIMRTASMAATVSSTANRPEDHQDSLAFTFFICNSLLSPDYGVPAEKQPIGNWFDQTWAHNTVVVDERSSQVDGGEARVIRRFGVRFPGVECVVDNGYPGVKHERSLMFAWNKCVLVDKLTSDKKHIYDWLLRCEAQPEVIGGGQILNNIKIKHPLIELNSAYRTAGNAHIRWMSEEVRVDHLIWSANKDTELIIATCPAENMERRVPLLICRQEGLKAEYLSLFAPCQPGIDRTITLDGRLIRIESEEQTEYIYLRALGEEQHPDIVTDAAYAAVSIKRGSVVSAMIADGSSLELNGQPVLRTPGKAEYAEYLVNDSGPEVYYSNGPAGIMLIRSSARTAKVNGLRAGLSALSGTGKLRITQQMVDALTKSGLRG